MFNIISHQKNINKNQMRYHHTLKRMAIKSKWWTLSSVDKNLENLKTHTLVIITKYCYFGKVLSSFLKVKHTLPYSTRIPLLFINLKKWEHMHTQKYLYPTFLVTVFIIAKSWNNSKGFNMVKIIIIIIIKMWYITEVEYYSAIKRH